MFDDENEDDECGGQTRYPVMPSLIALQQMKNRLQLAYLGKKLMKWTALATVKELRKLAVDMSVTFDDYGDNFAKAYMLIARSRYYYPTLNNIVLQNVGNEACCTVQVESKSVAGVKLLQIKVTEEPFDPNAHLGLEKGGTTISDTKKAWRDLLKLVILMVQVRTSFDALNTSHNAASKKQNVLGKLVIPRIINALAYIKSELEEMEREETFRLKRFKQSKEKKSQLAKEKLKKKQPVICCQPRPVEEIPVKKEEPVICCQPQPVEIPKEIPVKIEEPIKTPEPIKIPEPVIIQEPILKEEPKPIVKKEDTLCGCTDPRSELDQSTGKFICPICSLADQNVEIKVVACKLCLPEVNEVKERADHLMAHINQVLTLSRFYNKPLSGMDKKISELSYADVKKALENIKSICACPHIEKIVEAEPQPPCGCAICALKDMKIVQKGNEAVDKKPAATCLVMPSGGGSKETKPEQYVNDCCKNKLQLTDKKPDAPSLPVSSGKPEQYVNDCCKNKPLVTEKKSETPSLPKPPGCLICGSKDIKSDQKGNDCACQNKPQTTVTKAEAPSLPKPSGCVVCGSKDIKSEQKENDSACKNKPEAPSLPEPSGCVVCGSKDIKSEQKGNDCACKNKPQATEKKPEASSLPEPSGCIVCGSKNIKSEQKGNDCPCKNKPQVIEKKPEAPRLPEPSGCLLCGSKDIKSEQKGNDCPCKNKPQVIEKKPEAPSLPEPSGCLLCGSKDIKSEQKGNDCPCKNKPQAIQKKPEAQSLPKSSGCTTCGLKDIKSEQTANYCDCKNKPQAIEKKPEASNVPKTSGCIMCGLKDSKPDQKANESSCMNKPQLIKKKPDTPNLPEPSGCVICGSKNMKSEQQSKPSGCVICGSKDIKSDQKGNDCACQNKPQTTVTKAEAPSLPKPSGCVVCGSKDIKSEQQGNNYDCSNKLQDTKTNAPCHAVKTSEQKPDDCCISKSLEKQHECCENSLDTAECTSVQEEGFCSCTKINLNSPKEKSCCDGAGITKSDYRTYNLCSIPVINGPCFQSATDLYQSSPPFFYLYSGSYIHSETGLHPICNGNMIPQNNTVPKKCLCSNAPYYSEFKQDNPICSSSQNILCSFKSIQQQTSFSCISCSSLCSENLTKNSSSQEMTKSPYFKKSTMYFTDVPQGFLPILTVEKKKESSNLSDADKTSNTVSLSSRAISSDSAHLYSTKEYSGIHNECALNKFNSKQYLSDYNRTDDTSGCCNFSENKCITDSFKDIAEQQSLTFPSHTQVVNPRLCNISPTNLCDKSPGLVSSIRCGSSETQSILSMLDSILQTQGKSSATQNSSIQKTSSTPSTHTKDFSIYITMTPLDNSPYKRRLEKRPEPVTYTDCSTYCTVVSKNIRSYACEKRSLGVSEADNRTEFFKEITQNERNCCGCTFSNINGNCTATVTPYTREGKPGPCGLLLKCHEFLKNYTTTRRKDGSDTYSIRCSTNKQTVLSPSFSCKNRSEICCVHEKKEMPISWSRMSSERPGFTREGMPGPCCALATEVSACSQDYLDVKQHKNARPVPYFRERIPGPCGLSKVDNTKDSVGNISTYQSYSQPSSIPHTRDVKSRPAGISDIRAKVSSNTVTCTRQGRQGTCDICNQIKMASSLRNINQQVLSNTREGISGACDVPEINYFVSSENKTVLLQPISTEPYTRVGMPGPCGLRHLDARHNSNLTPCTREGRPGPCSISKTNNDARQFSEPAPYTREYRAGPCDISKMNKSAISTTNTDPRHFMDQVHFTRQGRPGPCDISETKNSASVISKHSLNFIPNIPKHREPCNMCVKNKITCSQCAIDPRESISPSSFTRDGDLKARGKSKTNPISSSLYNTALNHFSQYTPYTREGAPGICGVTETNFANTQNKISTQCGDIGPYTREGKPGPCGLSPCSIKSSLEEKLSGQFTAPEPFTREKIPGPCDISGRSYTANKISKIDPKHIASHTQNENHKPCIVCGREHTICSKCARDSCASRNLGISATEGFSRPCGVSKLNNNAKSISNNNVSKTNPTESSNYNKLMNELNTKNKTHNFSPSIIADISDSRSFSERKNILNSLYNKSCQPYTHILPSTEVNKRKRCSECERNGITCPLCIIDPKESTNSNLYTREGVPGPCGISETKNNASSLCNRELHIQKPYTREGVPGPCGISEKILTFPHYKLYASYACQLKPAPWNKLESPDTTESSKVITSVYRPCKIEEHSQLAQRRSSGKNNFNFYDTPSCLMYPVFTPCGTYARVGPQNSSNPATKDATTYVTAVVCPVRNTREASLKNFGACDRKITFNTSTSYSTRNCKPHAPQTCINVTHSLNAIPRLVSSSCRPFVKVSAAPVMILPSHVTSMASSTIPSKTCCCKSGISSVSTIKPGHYCDKLLDCVGSNIACTTCGRTAPIKANLRTTSTPLIKPIIYANCDKLACSHVSVCKPCSSCRNTKLLLSCMSNPSVKSIAIGTCTSRNRCNSGNIKKQSCFSFISKDSKTFMDESKFGYFEIGKKKVTKIYRYKNPDGTITDEKRVIVIKTEKKCPEKLEASGFEAKTTSDCLNNDKNRNRNKNEIDVPKFSRQSKSDTCCKGKNEPMTYPQIRYCISTQDCNSMAVNNNCLIPSPDLLKNANGFVTTINRSSTVTYPCGAICTKRLEKTNSVIKCGLPNKSSIKSPKLVCDNCFPIVKSRSKYSSADINPCTPTGPVSDNRPKDTDRGPKCACENKSNFKSTTPVSLPHPVCNGLQDTNKLPFASVQPLTPDCGNRFQDSDSGTKCDCTNKSTPEPPTSVCANRLQDTGSGLKCECAIKSHPFPATGDQTTTHVCANRLQDSDSGPKCVCAGESTPKPPISVCANRLQNLQDTGNGSKCECANKLPPFPATGNQPTTPVCANRLHDLDSEPKCKCASKSTPKSTTPVCANREQDSDSGPKCDCASKSTPKPPTPVCANRLQDTGTGPKCDCANKSSPFLATGDHPTTPVCANRLQDSDNGLKCNCASKSTPKSSSVVCTNAQQDSDKGSKCDCTSKSTYTPACANRIQNLDSGPKCVCAGESTPKSLTPVCADRVQDSDSGPKCDCTSKSTPEPPTPACGNRLEATDSGPKCECANKSRPFPATGDQPTIPVCANRLQDSDSGPKCVCAGESTPKPPTPVCANRLQDSDSGPKCDCANKSPPFSATGDQPTTPVCANRLQDSDSGPKCVCVGESTPKPPSPVCANRLQDSDSGPKCDCANKSPPISATGNQPTTPVCANREQDSDSGPKCDCASKSTPKPSTPVCANRLKDSDSGQKCECANKSPAFSATGNQPTTPVCANRLQDSDSGPKCDCAGASTPKPPTPVCANRLQDSDSGPKCDCANKSPPFSATGDQPTTPVCANRLQDSDSGPKCVCAGESTPKPPTPVCANRLQDSDSGPKCDCSNKSPPFSATGDQPTTPVCANRLQDSDSGPKCVCAGETTPKPPTPVCANRLQDSDSGPKCNCSNKSPPFSATGDQPTTPVCANRLQDSDSGPKCVCAGESTPKPPTPVCANRLQDSDSGPKCDCPNKSTLKSITPVNTNRQDSDCGARCNCADESLPRTNTPVQSTPVYANRLQDSDRVPKCDRRNKSNHKPPSPLCANPEHDTDSRLKCVCTNKSTPKPAIVDQATNHAKTQQDLHNKYICDCANKSHSLPVTKDRPITPICDNLLNYSDSSLGCSHVKKLTPKPPSSVSSKQSQTIVYPSNCNYNNESSPIATHPCQKPLNSCQCNEITEQLHSAKSQDKEVCCSIQKKVGIMKNVSDMQENSVKDNKEYGYVYIVPPKKATCNKALKSEIPCFNTNIGCCTSKLSNTNVPTSPKQILGHSCPAKITPKLWKNRCCSTNDTGKLSIFRGGSMLDALRQLFQSSNSRTQNHKAYDKNICKTCYSPISHVDDDELLDTPLCTFCKEKFIDGSERDYRLTNYSTEPGSPASKRSPSPFGQTSFLSTSSYTLNANVDHCCPTMVSAVMSTDSSDSLCSCGESNILNTNCNDVATSTRVRDETYVRVIKKGKIKHACVPDVKDCASHTEN